MKKILCLFTVLISLSACNSDSNDYNSGYSDGYAVGYNTTCKLRGNLIKGDFDNKNYSAGYANGRLDGSADCKSK
tara:strand:- start:4774 stop:4998 length:225 start_codon:yes stop_codon:yes gene_type:complete